MCCRGTETNIIHREKKGRLWAQEIKRCERGSFRANRKRITVVCDFLLIRGFWRLFQALCHLPVSLATALLETRWSLGIYRLAFVRGLTHTYAHAQLMQNLARPTCGPKPSSKMNYLILTSRVDIGRQFRERNISWSNCYPFHGGIWKRRGVEKFECWSD